jgi:hypothetical protein
MWVIYSPVMSERAWGLAARLPWEQEVTRRVSAVGWNASQLSLCGKGPSLAEHLWVLQYLKRKLPVQRNVSSFLHRLRHLGPQLGCKQYQGTANGLTMTRW